MQGGDCHSNIDRDHGLQKKKDIMVALLQNVTNMSESKEKFNFKGLPNSFSYLYKAYVTFRRSAFTIHHVKVIHWNIA